MAFIAQQRRGNQVGYREWERANLLCHLDLHCSITNMNVSSFLQIHTPLNDTSTWSTGGALETILKAKVFVNEADNQVRAAHKILGYNLIQKSFPAPKHMIRSNDPRF